MIISEAHKYVFIQFPQAASTAIARELVENYDGRHILAKHSNYHHFRRWAGAAASEYFSFTSIRSPLDKQVSLYHKFRSDHKNHFSDPAAWKKNGGWLSRRQLRRFRYVQGNDASFESFFRRFFWLPFVDWSIVDHRKMDFVIRYETLQEDFCQVLKLMEIPQVRPVPAGNPTKKSGGGEGSYYPVSLGARATWVLGPMLRYWDYPIPSEWGRHDVMLSLARPVFHVVGLAKRFYYNHLW